jgi:hypothetical protein
MSSVRASFVGKEQDEFVNSAKSIGFERIDETKEMIFDGNYSVNTKASPKEEMVKRERRQKLIADAKRERKEEMAAAAATAQNSNAPKGGGAAPPSPVPTVVDEVLGIIFQSMDKDKNGTIEKRELFKALLNSSENHIANAVKNFPMLAPLLKPKHFEETFLAMDASHDHKITLAHFKDFATSILQPHAKLYVHLVRGKGLRKADGVFGKSDPYVKVFLRTKAAGEKEIGSSRVCRKTLDPTYNQVFCAQFDLSGISWDDMGVRLEVYDEDRKGTDDFLGQVDFHGTSLHDVLGKSQAEDFKLGPRERGKGEKKDKKPTGTLQLRCSLGELTPFKVELPGSGAASTLAPQAASAAGGGAATSTASEVLALQTTIKRLTKQLARVKKEKNLAADLLDRRATEHEDELKKEELRLKELEKKYLVAAEVDKKKIHGLIESNYELSERVQELDDKLKETTELALALHENGATLDMSNDEEDEDGGGIGDSDFPLSESEAGSPLSASEKKLGNSGGSDEPFSFKPLKFDGVKLSTSPLSEKDEEASKNAKKTAIFDSFDFDFENDDNFKSMALTDLMDLDHGPRQVFGVASKDGFIPGVFWNGLCARYNGKCGFVDFPSIVRMEIVKGSKLGMEIIKHTSMGRAVPGTILADIAMSSINQRTNGNIVLYGFPNTIGEHMALKQALKAEHGGRDEPFQTVYVDLNKRPQDISIFSHDEAKHVAIAPLTSLKEELEKNGSLLSYTLSTNELQDDKQTALKRLQNFFYECLKGDRSIPPSPAISEVGTPATTMRGSVALTPEVEDEVGYPSTPNTPAMFSTPPHDFASSTPYSSAPSNFSGPNTPMQLGGQQKARNMVRFQNHAASLPPPSQHQQHHGYASNHHQQQLLAPLAHKSPKTYGQQHMNPAPSSRKGGDWGNNSGFSQKRMPLINAKKSASPKPPMAQQKAPEASPAAKKPLKSSLEERAIELIRWLKHEPDLPRKKQLEKKPLLVSWKRYYSNGYVMGKIIEFHHKKAEISAVKMLKLLEDGSSSDIKLDNWELLIKYFKRRHCKFPVTKKEATQIREMKSVDVLINVLTRLYYYVYTMKTVVTPKLNEAIIGENPLPTLMAAVNAQAEKTQQLPQWKLQQQRQQQANNEQYHQPQGNVGQYQQASPGGHYGQQQYHHPQQQQQYHHPQQQQPVGHQNAYPEQVGQMGNHHKNSPMGQYQSPSYQNGYQNNNQQYGHR